MALAYSLYAPYGTWSSPWASTTHRDRRSSGCASMYASAPSSALRISGVSHVLVLFAQPGPCSPKPPTTGASEP